MKSFAIRDFTTLPGARFKRDGDGSAEEFFNRYLKNKVDKNDAITLDFDGTWGYASSFLSQLAIYIASLYDNVDSAKGKVTIISNNEPSLADRFWDYVEETDDEEEN